MNKKKQKHHLFTDINGRACEVVKSSLATDNAIRIGIGEDKMHLNIKQTEQLIMILQRFVKYGEL